MDDTDTTEGEQALADGELDDPFFSAWEDTDFDAENDPVLESKRSPAVTARRARLSRYVKAILVGATALVLFAAITHLDARESRAADRTPGSVHHQTRRNEPTGTVVAEPSTRRTTASPRARS